MGYESLWEVLESPEAGTGSGLLGPGRQPLTTRLQACGYAEEYPDRASASIRLLQRCDHRACSRAVATCSGETLSRTMRARLYLASIVVVPCMCGGCYTMRKIASVIVNTDNYR